MDHITVCICTFKRAHLLLNLMQRIEQQASDGLFSVSICIVDNDSSRSARDVVLSYSTSAIVPVKYVCEPQQNIARARNTAVENSGGEYIAFIDDDEIPEEDWLLDLYKMIRSSHSSGVLGPVVPLFHTPPPPWVLDGRIFDRPSAKTGENLHWTDTRTGNVLLNRALFDVGGHRFDTNYGRGGEDREFFRRMIAGGNQFVWCNDAVVREIIPPHRWTRSFLLRRALLRGKVAVPTPFSNLPAVVKSIVAILVFLPMLPVLFVWSHGVFMRHLIRTFDHIGRLLAFLGIDVVKEYYIS